MAIKLIQSNEMNFRGAKRKKKKNGAENALLGIIQSSNDIIFWSFFLLCGSKCFCTYRFNKFLSLCYIWFWIWFERLVMSWITFSFSSDRSSIVYAHILLANTKYYTISITNKSLKINKKNLLKFDNKKKRLTQHDERYFSPKKKTHKNVWSKHILNNDTKIPQKTNRKSSKIIRNIRK